MRAEPTAYLFGLGARRSEHLTSVFWCLKHEVTRSPLRAAGPIVNNASVAGGVGVAGMSAYAAAKYGVVGLTRSAALEWADRGVHINALLTGNVDTPLFRGLLGVSEVVPWVRRLGGICTPTAVPGLVGLRVGAGRGGGPYGSMT
jgi:NAD(P)-dependent dehydrogenase (short-subunit alcohol dehydrogenase family)